MKTTGLLLAALFLSFSLVSCSDSATKTAENNPDSESVSSPATGSDVALSGIQTIRGEILDMSCYMDHDATGESHKKCAQGCLDKGLPAGIMAENGQVYLLLEDHDASGAYKTALKHAAENISVTGEVVNKKGVQSLVVKEVKEG